MTLSITTFSRAGPSVIEFAELLYKLLGNCDSFVKQKISVINETKRDEISLKPKV